DAATAQGSRNVTTRTELLRFGGIMGDEAADVGRRATRPYTPERQMAARNPLRRKIPATNDAGVRSPRLARWRAMQRASAFVLVLAPAACGHHMEAKSAADAPPIAPQSAPTEAPEVSPTSLAMAAAAAETSEAVDADAAPAGTPAPAPGSQPEPPTAPVI